MKHRRLLSFFLLSAFLGVAVSFAQDKTETPPEYRLTVRAERSEPIYAKGETVVFRVQLFEKDKPFAGQKIRYVVLGDGNYEKKGTVDSTDSFAVIETSLNRPGFLKCNVDWNDGTNKLSGIAGAAVAPLEIKAARPEPKDFDEFWKAKKDELQKLPLDVKLEKITAGNPAAPGVEVFDVKVNCTGGKPVSGYLAKPVDAKPKSLPIIISYHGAGVRSANMPIGDAAKGALALDINAHGLDNGKPTEYYDDLYKGPMKDYRWEKMDNRDEQYFVGMFQRVFRSLQFMKSLPEWDGKTLVVKGGSQGGGQALAAAGLDGDVTFCVALVPAICYHTGYIDNEFGGWPGFLRGKTATDADPAIVAAVPYVDAAIHAKRIKAECVLTVGFVDYTCSPTSVYVAYNNIPTPKQIVNMSEQGHHTPPAESNAVNKLLWEHVKKRR